MLSNPNRDEETVAPLLLPAEMSSVLQEVTSDLEMFSLCCCKASRSVSGCMKCSRSSISRILVLSTFISAWFQDFSYRFFLHSLCQASRRCCQGLSVADSWHQHGDFKTLLLFCWLASILWVLGKSTWSSVRLWTLLSISPQWKFLLQLMRSFEYLFRLFPLFASTAGQVKWWFLLLQSAPASAACSKGAFGAYSSQKVGRHRYTSSLQSQNCELSGAVY